jgi:protein TonB
MKPKKSKKANLENLRTIFFQIGMILTLSLVLVAFEWTSGYEFEPIDFVTSNDGVIELDIPITRPEKEEPIKVDPPSFEIDIVKDEFDVPEVDLSHLISEIGENDPIDIIEFDETETIIEEFVKVEIMPTFQGKNGRYFRNYVASEVKFPASAIETGVSGTVFASFVIDENGKVVDAIITRQVHPVIDNAVLKVIENSPEWEPGINNGEYVRVKYAIAIAFKLQ